VNRDRAGQGERVELLADREGRVENGDRDSRASERAVDDVGALRLALVEDDRGGRAGGLRVRAFTTKSHVPRWMRATRPAVDAGKSVASQPLLEVLAVAPGGMTMSFVGTISPVTSPAPEYSMRLKSVPKT
jgi:hypothetical protein